MHVHAYNEESERSVFELISRFFFRSDAVKIIQCLQFLEFFAVFLARVPLEYNDMSALKSSCNQKILG